MWPFLLLFSTASALVTREPPVPAPRGRDLVEEMWVDVRLDHFHASNVDTFPMRFYYNPEFATTGDHILIYVGGEWSISPGWLRAGLMYEAAADAGAAMFYTEHRYYGKTRPTEDTSVPNLRYLTADQALADLAQFITHVRSEQFEDGKYRNASVGLVGCSYAGSLATWARRAAPHLVDVAFSDSGPVRAQEDFPEYLEVISSALETQGGAACVSSVRAGMEGLVALLETSDGPQRVSEMFNTCAPLTPSPLDLATFFWFGVTETFAYLVQYATPGDIEQACAKLTDASVADPTLRLASWVTSQSNAQPCIEARYAEVVASHTNTSYDAEDSVMRLWTYQLCVDYGWWQTTSSSEQPFLSAVPIEYFHQMCQDFYSSDFTRARTTAGIARTNLLFSSSLPDRVVSVAGTGDPWSPAGPGARDATALAPVLVVEGVTHCRAIRPTGDSETEQLEQAKNSVKEFLKAGLKGEPLFIINSASGAGASLALAVVAMFVTLLW
ncbi:hypothetical protein JYU34_022453 [Plutella xylostella]|uniref:Serine protease K12H4.7 n=1 Tax=Plutella xylostella TaxID=51655 RepID=A0ABQ7PQY4_PLUXY|nr:hypothetical protein JYU34_022453 [Plutella xylostella]